MANFNKQIPLRRCLYASRGCTNAVKGKAFLSHHVECGFAPVQCSHEGCEETVNRQDLDSHQKNCEFQSVTCDDCDETMKQRDYGNHSCALRRELADVKRILREIQGGQLRPGIQPYARQGEQGDNLRQQTSETIAQGQRSSHFRERGRDLVQFETTEVKQVVTRRLASEFMRQPNATQRQQGNCRELTGPCMSPDFFRAACSISSPIQSQAAVEKQILVAGGGHKSYEVFNWSTQKWTLYEDSLFFNHDDAFSFLYDNKIMICGGTNTNRMECLHISNRSVSTFPAQLPGTDCGKGVLCGDKILTFGQSVSATSLKPPFKTTVLASYDEGEEMACGNGIARIDENTVVLLGGCDRSLLEEKDDVLLYNMTTKQMEQLAPLPYQLADMTVVVHDDNIILLGGRNDVFKHNDVLMYNITNQQCSKLPSMLENRSRCAAVIMGDTIVVMGGGDLTQDTSFLDDQYYRNTVNHTTAEYLVLGENKWKELPPMHHERVGATACLLP